ncbi:MAG: RNA-dependent DNA polymerase [Elusimicrobia bacterium CG11_big_fil_rev_8_21_14_0_20_64_6]|nr:MAG: RNA-dependent DNA polymerase [Elusimicrobia bacterium CG11_big_fil_rev_8_21_14_0_20_64_6]
MRRTGNLFERLCSFETLHRAFRLAARGKGERLYCARFGYERESELLRLQEELRSGTYRHGGYRDFTVHDPKTRQVRAAVFRDRVVHHALCGVIEPIFEARFISDSFACRKGKGTLAALERCKALARRFADGYALKLDAAKYFYSVDHEVLLGILARKIKDRRVLALCREILASSQDRRFRGYFPGDDLLALLRPTGIPIGNLSSQLFSNIYLGELDLFVKHSLRRKAYLRYMDDMLLFASGKAELWETLARIEAFLAERLRLRVHPKKRTVSPVRRGVDWVGYRVFPDRVRLLRRNIFRFRARNRRLRRLLRRRTIPTRRVRDSLVSFLGYARHAQAGRLMRRLMYLEAF